MKHDGKLISIGKLSVFYEGGFLRYLKVNDIEVVRMLYVALRDSQWETMPLKIANETIRIENDSFRITYEAINLSDDKELFRWNVKISGNSGGDIVFEVEGEAMAAFHRNRAGICVLHPIHETVGKPVQVIHPDGSFSDSEFPKYISPYQVFFSAEKLIWPIDDKLKGELRLEGDVFETEDQRNWMDASFKTYCAPLSIPFPVAIQKGHTVHQKATLKIYGLTSVPMAAGKSKSDIQISIDPSIVKSFPKIGTGHTSANLRPEE